VWLLGEGSSTGSERPSTIINFAVKLHPPGAFGYFLLGREFAKCYSIFGRCKNAVRIEKCKPNINAG
jgi:hypothetical protein